ncbi:MAG TPA: adenylyltransferase/cytidyltransferase family protein [Candidatus Paceibacterota bacterium]|nr:adenylyltransferase/cytidyltransferase family protein [Candidatus Paceibacterota bacterium]
MKKVFVSGCYDILHAGHIQFFKDARALGDHLTVSFASKDVLALSKKRKPSLPDDHKMIIIGSLSCVDEVVTSSDLDPVFDFKKNIKRIKPEILAVTEDDRNAEVKRQFCAEQGIKFVVLPKRRTASLASTTSILAGIHNVSELPLRVDFAGGWLDVPRFSKKGTFIVNCTITPKVSLSNWPYEQGGGLGGSAAYALLQVKNGVASEIDLGVGWQDPAVINETGLCVWRSGKEPVLDAKFHPDWLAGKMLIVWTGTSHVTPGLVDKKRDFKLIAKAGGLAKDAVYKKSLPGLARAINTSYKVQIGEGMEPLQNIVGSIAKKYLGGGHGGYSLYLFDSEKKREKAFKKIGEAAKKIEPYIKPIQ